MNNQIPRGQTSLVLLEALMDGGDKYGAEFLLYVQSKHPNFEIKQPTLYSTLSRMEKQGLISSYWRDSELGGKRHYYSLTDFGKKVFEDQKFELDAQNDEKKYDEIGGFQKNNDGLLTNKNSSQNFEMKNDDFLVENDLSSVQSQNFTQTNENDLKTDDGIFLTQDETYYIPEEKYDEIDQFEKTDDQKDDGIFITDTMAENQIPKVKKIASDLNFDLGKNDFSKKIVKPMEIETTSEKIENLYHKQKSSFDYEKKYDDFEPQSDESQSKPGTLKTLGERYKNMNISFYTDSCENSCDFGGHFGKIPSSKLFAKYFTIFLLILFESAGIWSLQFFVGATIQYQFAYIILPIIFGVVSFSILFSKKKYYKFEKQSAKNFWIYGLIFVVGLVLLYSLNLILGITFQTIWDFKTTFVYPAILLTNVLVAGIFDTHFAKKFYP